MSEQQTTRPLITLGVSGCIGAYKSAELTRRLQDQGIDVQPVMTRAAAEFITPLTLSTLSGRETVHDMWSRGGDWDVKHISISDQQSALLVAPATANCIGKFAHGIADDFLSTLYLATEQPVILAPAMNAKMWRHPATQENLARLIDRGVTVVQPGSGWLACGWEGEGRLADIPDIVDAAGYAAFGNETLKGKHCVVTAGPTAEDIDAIRFLTNRSSGKMGYALAAALRARGARVTIVSGPVNIRKPWDVDIMNVRSAAEMYDAVMKLADSADVICKVAAVADYRPAHPREDKIRKEAGLLKLELERTRDILAELGKRNKRPFLVGFAAESSDIGEKAARKLAAKGADMIIGNRIGGESSAAGGDESEGMIIHRDGATISMHRQKKSGLAAKIADEIALRLEKYE